MKPHNTEDQTTDEATKTHKIKQHIKPQKHIRSNNTWSHKNTQDQTTHEATKTHKIKQHMKPQKHGKWNHACKSL